MVLILFVDCVWCRTGCDWHVIVVFILSFVFLGISGELCIHLVRWAAFGLHGCHVPEGPGDKGEILQGDRGRVSEGP